VDTFLKQVVIKVNGEESDFADDTVMTEYPLMLYVNGKEFQSFYCTPGNLEELVVEYLKSRNMLHSKDEILDLVINEKINSAKIRLTEQPKSIERKPLSESMIVQIQTIYEIMKTNLTASTLFKETGGAHSVAIFDKEKPLIILEDVARHNAVDKIIGYCFMNNIDYRNKILVVSGRISASIFSKADKVNIPIVLSKSAPTSLSIERAKASGITLVGFIRGERMNIYTHPMRIDLGDNAFRTIPQK